MSLSYAKLRPVKLEDPRLRSQDTVDYGVESGAQQVTAYQATTQSVGTNSMIWSLTIPTGAVMDRRLLMYVPVRLTFQATSTASGQTVLNANFDAPRAWPLSGSIDTATLTLNGDSYTISMADVIHVIGDHFNSELIIRRTDWSGTPTMADRSTEYSALQGAVSSPLAQLDSYVGNEPPRGAFSSMVVVANPASTGSGQLLTAIVDLAICEPLVLSPASYSEHGLSTDGFYNLTTVALTLNFTSNVAQRMWSRCGVAGSPTTVNGVVMLPISSYAFSFSGSGGPSSFGQQQGNVPLLLYNLLSPKATMTISPSTPVSYGYKDVQRFITQGQSVPAFGSSGYANVVIASNTIQLPQIPSRIFCCVRQQNNDLYADATATDTYFMIQNCSILFQNQNSYLQPLGQQQLYRMTVANGYVDSYVDWLGLGQKGAMGTQIGTSGSVLCINPSCDFGLGALEANGISGQVNLQINLTVTNTHNIAIVPVLVIVAVYEGVATVTQLGKMCHQIGVVTQRDVLSVADEQGISLKDVQGGGGDLFSGLKGIHSFLKSTGLASKVARGVSAVAQHLGHPTIANVASSAANLAEQHGYGYERSMKSAPKMRRARVGVGAGYDRRDDYEEAENERYSHGGAYITSADLERHIEY